MQVEGLGDKANDLKDRRDLLVEQLSEIMSINTIDESDNSVSIMVGALRIVQRDTYRELDEYIIGQDKVGIRIKGGTFPEITAGALKGLFKVRDEIIPEFQHRLDVLASAITNRVNRYHMQGWGLDGKRGRVFFNDTHTAQLKGTVFLPAGTTEDTTLFNLGVTEGFFELQDTRITLTYDEVSPDNSLTLGDLLERINQSQPTVRASLKYDALNNPYISFDLYNPAQEDDGIKLFAGSTNFLVLTGLDGATLEFLPGNDFYSNAAARINTSELLQGNLDIIAAGLDPGDNIFPGVGDNTNALRIAGLEDDTMAVEGTTLEDFYNGIISSLGVQSQANSRLVANQEVLVSQLKNQRESISGVNLDEEAINMIEFQRMYEGAARIVSVVDTLLDTLINRMGVT
jgi:flagellar hook-associated protein 1 FlgK